MSTLRDIVGPAQPARAHSAIELTGLTDPKTLARFYHEECGMDYYEACNRAHYDPGEEARFGALVFVILAAGFCLAISITVVLL